MGSLHDSQDTLLANRVPRSGFLRFGTKSHDSLNVRGSVAADSRFCAARRNPTVPTFAHPRPGGSTGHQAVRISKLRRCESLSIYSTSAMFCRGGCRRAMLPAHPGSAVSMPLGVPEKAMPKPSDHPFCVTLARSGEATASLPLSFGVDVVGTVRWFECYCACDCTVLQWERQRYRQRHHRH